MSTRSVVNHPSAWRASQLFETSSWNMPFSDEEVVELRTAAVDFDPDASDAVGNAVELPVLRSKFKTIQQQLEHGSGVVRLRGFPASDVSVAIAKRAFELFCRHIGTPVSQSAIGERLFSVRDAGFTGDDARARGPNTRKKLSFHTDRCDVIAFLCYRQAKSGGVNQVVSSVALYNQLLEERPDLVEVLMQPYLYQRHNVDTGNELPYIEQPIFSFHEGHFAANLLRVLIERAYAMPETPEMSGVQREALDVLESVADRKDFHAEFRQQQGDILLLNNFVTFHRRTEFVDHEDEDRKRHLLRVWLSMPNSRPLDPRFAGNYGATAAGAVRGGMNPRH